MFYVERCAGVHDIFVPISMRHGSIPRGGSGNAARPSFCFQLGRGAPLALRGNLSILQRSDRRETIAVTL